MSLDTALGMYLLSVFLHGLWNTLAIFFAFATLSELFELENPLRALQTPLNVGMGVLSVVLLSVLVASNLRMQATLPKPIVQESVQPED